MANDLSAFKTEVFSQKLIMNLDKINVMMPLVNRDWEGELAKLGDTVHVRTLGSVTLSAYSKATPINYQDLAPAKEPMVVDDAQYFAFQVDDVDLNQNSLDALGLYAQRAAVAVNDKIEAKLLSNYTDAHANNRITGAASAAIALDASNIYGYFVDARNKLTKQNVPTIGRWAVIDPDTESLILKSDYFAKGGTAASDSVKAEGGLQGHRPGFLGNIAGFAVFVSNSVPVASGAKYLQFGDKYAIAYAAQINEIERLRLESQFATAVRGLLLHDTKVFAEAAKRLGYIKAVA